MTPPKAAGDDRVAESHLVNHNLFSSDFLDRGFPKLPEFAAAGEALPLLPQVRAIYLEAGSIADRGRESSVEANLVNPILALLNPYYLSKEPLSTGQVPDYAFVPDAASKVAGNHSAIIAVADAKEAGKEFDRSGGEKRSPVRQVYDYLVDSQTRWGFVTDGSRWRLLHRDSSADRYLEVNLRAVALAGDIETWLRFYLLFRREAFLIHRDGSFLDRLKSLSDQHSFAISEGLKQRVYLALLELATGLVSRPRNHIDARDPAVRKELRQGCFVLLYRLLFLFYAEARGLLPIEKEEYARYSLKRLRQKAREVVRRRTLQVEGEYDMWRTLSELFRIVNEGDSRLGVTAYNGGLFASDTGSGPLQSFQLTGVEVANEYLARAIELLGTQPSPEDPGETVDVDYSRLEIRHLGSIYEGLLEYRIAHASEDLVSVKVDQEERWVPSKSTLDAQADPTLPTVREGSLYLETETHERRATGSFYTPESIVKYIVRETLKPLIDARVAESRSDGRSPVDSLLSLRVCDPAMGSGHFLVEATEFL